MKWKKKDYVYLKDNYKNLTKQALALNLNRTFRAVEVKMVRLGLSSRDICREEITCLKCNKKFKCLKKEKRKFCSRYCSASVNTKKRGARSEETKKRISLANTGKISPNRSKSPITGLPLEYPFCIVCSSKCPRMRMIYCCRKCRDNCPKLKEKLSRISIERYLLFPEKHPNRRCAGIKESFPEKGVRLFLESNGLKANMDFIQQFKIDKYFVDFLIINLNLIIEVDGKYWHKDKEKEKIREDVIKKNKKLIRLDAKSFIDKKYNKLLSYICERSVTIAQITSND